jgi:outer membrane receptor protein involved in Fe transport
MNTASKIILTSFLIAACAWGQSTTALIFGTVRDSSDATVPEATIKVTERQTGLTRSTATTVADGNYQFTLPRGVYDLRVSHAGFKTEVRESIALSTEDRVQVDVVLSIGEVTEAIPVSAVVSPVNTAASELSRVVTGSEVAALPLNNRKFSLLPSLTTGVIPSKPNTVSSLSFNGASQYGINLSLDGTDATSIETPTFGDPSQQSRLNTVSLESIAETQIDTGTFSAVNGRATGAVVNIISKSGTNDLHGSLFEYFRNNYLDANNYFATSSTPLRQNQFGGSLGGPILKNRLFFFGNYEGSRASIGQIVTANVPTQAFRDSAPAAYSPYFAALPLPTQAIAGSATTGVYRRQDRFVSDENLSNVRVDRIDDRSTLFLRYSLNRSENSTPNLFPTNRLVYPISNHLATIGYNYAFSSTLVNDLRLGFDRYDVPRSNQTFDQALGSITISGIMPTGNTEGVLRAVTDAYTLSDTLSKNVGRHRLRAGFEERRLDSYRRQVSNPIFAYNTAAHFLANTPDSVRLTYGHTGNTLAQWQTGLFLQDDWRVSSRVTLNLGLRYDYFSPLFETKGQYFNTGADPFGAFNKAGAPLYHGDKTNFEPRVGFAWDLFGNQRTVLRGGVGKYSIALPPFFIWNGATIDPRVPSSATFTPADGAQLSYPLSGILAEINRNPSLAASTGLVPAVVSRTVIDSNLRTPYTLTTNLTFEQAIAGTLYQLSYVGTRSLKSPGARALNLVDPATGVRTDPSIGEIDLTDSGNRRNYNALQIAVRRRFRKGLALHAHYTWSKLLIYGNEDSFGPTAVQDWSNIEASRGPGALSISHAFQFDATWQIPIGSLEQNRIAKAVLGGWVLSNITQARSGLPVNFATGRDIRGDGFANTQRPNYIGGSIYPENQTITNWFNAAAFANPSTGSFGNAGYNIGRGPNYIQIDAGLTRRLMMRERNSLDFRLEVFNLPNHPNFGQPDGNINSATFGRISSALDPRQLQLSLRYQF